MDTIDKKKSKILEGFCTYYADQHTCDHGPYWQFCEKGFFDPEHYSFEGVHTLKNGDRLIILSPDYTKIMWSGVIRLGHFIIGQIHYYYVNPDNGQPALAKIDVHRFVQKGVEKREEWENFFRKNYPAKLICRE